MIYLIETRSNKNKSQQFSYYLIFLTPFSPCKKWTKVTVITKNGVLSILFPNFTDSVFTIRQLSSSSWTFKAFLQVDRRAFLHYHSSSNAHYIEEKNSLTYRTASHLTIFFTWKIYKVKHYRYFDLTMFSSGFEHGGSVCSVVPLGTCHGTESLWSLESRSLFLCSTEFTFREKLRF